MAATDTDGTLYDLQEVSNPNSAKAFTFENGTNAYTGKMVAMYSVCTSATAGAAGDTISFMKLPPGAVIIGGWMYWEDGLGADDGDLADLGVVYEASDGTDDVDCIADGLDIYDGQTSPVAQEALPAGSMISLPTDVAAMPYVVTGGVGTVQLLSLTDAFVTAKDVHLMLYVILPGL